MHKMRANMQQTIPVILFVPVAVIVMSVGHWSRYKQMIVTFIVGAGGKPILLLFLCRPRFPQSLAHKEKRLFIVFWADKYPQLCRMVADKP